MWWHGSWAIPTGALPSGDGGGRSLKGVQPLAAKSKPCLNRGLASVETKAKAPVCDTLASTE